MKKIFLLTVLMVIMFVPVAFAREMPVEVFINRVELKSDQPAVLNKELKRTYLPLRAVAEYLGAQVDWIPRGVKVEGKRVPEVHIRKDGRLIIVPIGLKMAWINDGFRYEKVRIDAPAYIERATNRTMVPLRFISESLGTKVEWDNRYRVVYITDPNRPMGMCAKAYLEKGNLLNDFAKDDIEWHKNKGCPIVPIVMQGYPPYAAPDGTVWVRDVKFDGRYLTYTEKVDRFGLGVRIRFFDKYGNTTRCNYGDILEVEGVWSTRHRAEPHKDFPLKGEVTEIQFNRIYDGYSITWVYRVRD